MYKLNHSNARNLNVQMEDLQKRMRLRFLLWTVVMWLTVRRESRQYNIFEVPRLYVELKAILPCPLQSIYRISHRSDSCRMMYCECNCMLLQPGGGIRCTSRQFSTQGRLDKTACYTMQEHVRTVLYAEEDVYPIPATRICSRRPISHVTL